jgi:hypothetical protein
LLLPLYCRFTAALLPLYCCRREAWRLARTARTAALLMLYCCFTAALLLQARGVEAGAHRKNKHNSLKFYNGLGSTHPPQQ